MRRFLHRNGLSVVTLALFVLLWIAQGATGFRASNNELQDHGQPGLSLRAYLGSGGFWEATGENWESEFFQMAAFVLLTAGLYQRGSAESNPLPEEKRAEDSGPPQSGPRAQAGRVPWPVRRGGWVLRLYAHSLSLALLLLFALSFVIHLLGGTAEYNVQQALHNGSSVSPLGFLATAEFWTQSFQNWQSEFLSVAAMVLLTIFLRERGSAESKDLAAPHDQTGT